MYEDFLKYTIPISIAIVYVNFIWAWIVSAVKPPSSLEDRTLSAQINQNWKYMDTGPEGIKTTIPQKIKTIRSKRS
jgi:hypothetical protein